MKKILVFLFWSLGAKTQSMTNPQDYVYLGGETVGIVMDGEVEVSRTYDINGVKPWGSSNIKEGTIIEYINNFKISSVADVRDAVRSSAGNELMIKYRNENETSTTNVKPVKLSNSYSVGLDIKDKLEGVGTLTYIDQNYNYGALGHIVKTNLRNGRITESSISRIKKSVSGSPGYKNAKLGMNTYGTIVTNNFTGIYGTVDSLDLLTRQEKVKVGNRNDVKTGTAYIYTVLENNKVEKFTIKITDVAKQTDSDIKGMSIEVIDQTLLNKTGGIVQGMSGSPIVQNGKIIGAVTHVIIDKPETGYGIYIDWMLKNH